ncbi:MAG: hypothetical protein RSB71_00300 [Bacilli bacterium]
MPVIETILRAIFFKLDEIIYKFVGTVYNLLIEIAETTIFSSDIIEALGQRIYGLLGIFMLFKVSFSVLTYIVNPDEFTDKTKGFSKIISNIMITLALFVAVPFIFSQAFKLQRILLRDNVLGKIVLGGSGSSSSMNSSTANPGRVMGYETLRAFYYLDEETYPACVGISSGKLTDDSACISSAFKNQTMGATNLNSLKYAYNSKSVDLYLDADLIFAKDPNDKFTMTYIPLISTLAGGFIVLILISFCFDIAVRSIKLGFYQLIAPIPIISRIDPKKGKDVFDKWVKSCVSTYLDLFIRLLAIYFAVFVISQIFTGPGFTNMVTGEAKASGFVKVFIVLGALLFAKQLPKILEEILGIKLDGKFKLNPLKKLNEVPGVGKIAATAGGIVAGAKAGSHVGATGTGAFLGAMSGFKSTPFMGNKDGEASFFKGANASYKSLLGKDFVNFGASNFIPDAKKKDAIDEVGVPLKNAYKVLSSLNTNLNTASHRTANQAQKMTDNGINFTTGTSGEYVQDFTKIEKLNIAYSNEKDVNKKTKIQSEITQASAEFHTKYIATGFESSNPDINELKTYSKMSAAEESLRGTIGGVEKDIKDLSKEKSSREQFYRYDPSPEEDVKANINKYK